MTVTAVWMLLLVAALAWEVACHRSPGRRTSLAEITSRLWSGRAGRLLLVLLWAFVGWHLFARHGSPA
jgi:hypothetical protein